MKKFKKPDVRFLNEIKNVLYDRKWAKKSSNFPLYYMRRGIKEKNGLRYDITIIPPRLLGKEFVKTKGHEHFGDWREIYIVLEGKAIYLMQKTKNKKVEDVFFVPAKKGDIVIIPKNYGHVTINPTKKILKMANWINKKCQSNYTLFEKMGGACYFALSENSKIKWVKNKKYLKAPKLKRKKPIKLRPVLSQLKSLLGENRQ